MTTADSSLGTRNSPLATLIASSVRGRVVVLALCVLLVGYGFRTAQTAPLDVFPEFAPPKVEVQTEAPGLSTEEVEALISVPLENALNGTPGLKVIRSKSVLGLSSVVLLFEEGTDIHKARQYVQERVAAEAVRLPVVARPPVILQPLSSLSRVMKIGMSSKTMTQRDMTVLALWTIRPKLMSVCDAVRVRVPAGVPGDGFPDALRRQAGRVGRGDGPDDDPREPRPARDPRRAQLRLAHRARRSRGRGVRPELH